MAIAKEDRFVSAVTNARLKQQAQNFTIGTRGKIRPVGPIACPVLPYIAAAQFDHVVPREFGNTSAELENCAYISTIANWIFGQVQRKITLLDFPAYIAWKRSLIFKSGKPSNGVRTRKVSPEIALAMRGHSELTVKHRAERKKRESAETVEEMKFFLTREIAFNRSRRAIESDMARTLHTMLPSVKSFTASFERFKATYY